MTDFDDLPPDELAGARFDSELTDEDAVRVDADPDLARQVAAQASVSDLLKGAAAPPLPSSAMQERHLGAALAAFDALSSNDASLNDASLNDASSSEVVAADGPTSAAAASLASPPVADATDTNSDSVPLPGLPTGSPPADQSPTPPPASLRDARDRRRSIGPWVLSAAAALLVVVALVGIVNSGSNDDNNSAAASDGMTGDEVSADDGSSDAESAFDAQSAAESESPAAATAEPSSSALEDAADEAMAEEGDQAMAEDDAGDAESVQDGAMAEGDAMAEEDGGDAGSAMTEDDAMAEDGAGDDSAMEEEDGAAAGGTELSMPLGTFFDPDSPAVEVPTEGLPCLQEITALEIETAPGGALVVAPEAKLDPANAAITVFLFRTTTDGPAAAYAVLQGSCVPFDQARFD